MKTIKHILLLRQRMTPCLAKLLLPIIFFLQQNAIAATENIIITSINYQHKDDIHLLHSANSTLQSSLAEKITTLINKNKSTPSDQTVSAHSTNTSPMSTRLVIAIGKESENYASVNYKNNDTLLILSNPGEYESAKNSHRNIAILFMSQTYCKQIKFIKEINHKWTTISYLNNKKSKINTKTISECANKYGMKTYEVYNKQIRNLSKDINKALTNSNLLLALPSKSIYNSQSVKNILLTSYRNRKPVIGFSKNFVRAGALASIYSDTEQIAYSAINLINNYYKDNYIFKYKTNYPESFDIEINKQVFKALDITIPDIKAIKQSLIDTKFNSADEQ